MPPLSLLIKPASSNCNLRCRYCFYHDVAETRQVRSYGMMTSETLEKVVAKALDFADHNCTIAFQGGEPTLAGLDFFHLLVDLEKKYNHKNVRINNAIQTNGMVMDKEWAKFLAKNHFLVGLSLDGPKEIHDQYRFDAKSSGTFNRVMKTMALFNENGVEYNILTVVNSNVARHIGKIYSFFKKSGFRFLQFIPCLDPLGEDPGRFEYSLSPERYTHFLKTLFDLWYHDIIHQNLISIRYFDNLVSMLMGHPPESCGMSGVCNTQFVIEADGGVYPCDFYVLDEWHLGNIRDHGFPDLKFSEAGRRFEAVSRHIDPGCNGCQWYPLCRGGCRRSREPFVDGKPVRNYYCSSYQEFFADSVSRLQQLARMFAG